jgi:carboxypeptidase Taq
MSTHPAYDELCALALRIHRFEHLQALAHWDHATFMPPGGQEARAAALGEVAALLHRLRTGPELGPLLDAAAGEPLDPVQRANLRELRRAWNLSTALPEGLVQATSLATSRCEHAWRAQRPANDWAGFAVNLREVVRLVREAAQRLGDHLGKEPYEALLDRYEPGLSTARLDELFGRLRGWLPGLIQAAVARQEGEALVSPQGPFPVDAQQALSEALMRRLGFDFGRGRLDRSAHPFTGGVPEDVRLTTRFDERTLLPGLMGTIHETGHARYEQGRPVAWLGLPVSEARSMALHESQSLAFEMQLGRSRPFAEVLGPMLSAAFGPQPAFEPAALYRALTQVRPGKIRVDADEVTYPAHILLRTTLERELIAGALSVDDLPARWDAGMAELLGLSTVGDFKDGPLQDIHWSVGAFGYFPCYTLGAMYAAQWFTAAREARPRLEEEIAAGELEGLFQWLAEQIWQQGSRWETDELAIRVSGRALSDQPLRDHLERRYLGER